MADVLYRSDDPAVTAVAALLRSGIAPGGVALRVDEDAVTGELTTPMCVVSGHTVTWWRAPMGGDQLAYVQVTVSVVGASLSQVRAVRAEVVRQVAGTDSVGAFWSPLAVSGFRVVRREVDGTLGEPYEGGGLAQGVAVFELWLERAA